MHFHSRTRVIEDRESDKLCCQFYIHFRNIRDDFPWKDFCNVSLDISIPPDFQYFEYILFYQIEYLTTQMKTYSPIQYWSSSLSFISSPFFFFFFWSHSIIICVCNEERKKCMQVDIKCFVEFCDTNNRTSINSNKIIFFKYIISSFFSFTDIVKDPWYTV